MHIFDIYDINEKITQQLDHSHKNKQEAVLFLFIL